jgi:GNAT superfamily N-acetyltransferase
MTGDAFQIRPARAADREAVLAFCAQTWEWGDYIGEVWDQWLADRGGVLVVGEVGGQVMGVDKLTFLAPGEAFFEGLRIAPAYRGRGYAGRFQRFMLAEAANRGAHVLRFLTAADNTPIHKNAARDAFVRGPALLGWQAPPAATSGARAAVPLKPGPVAEALWAALPHSPLWTTTGGLVSHSWHVQAWTRPLWDSLLAAGRLFTLPAPTGSAIPGLIALIPEQHYPDAVWLAYLDDGALDAGRLAALAAATRAVSSARGWAEFHAMLPRVPAIEAGLQAAGWKPRSDEGTLLVFEKKLTPTAQASHPFAQ